MCGSYHCLLFKGHVPKQIKVRFKTICGNKTCSRKRQKKQLLDPILAVRSNYLDQCCLVSPTIILKYSQFEDREL